MNVGDGGNWPGGGSGGELGCGDGGGNGCGGEGAGEGEGGHVKDPRAWELRVAFMRRSEACKRSK